jgi:hypothetical protein
MSYVCQSCSSPLPPYDGEYYQGQSLWCPVCQVSNHLGAKSWDGGPVLGPPKLFVTYFKRPSPSVPASDLPVGLKRDAHRALPLNLPPYFLPRGRR